MLRRLLLGLRAWQDTTLVSLTWSYIKLHKEIDSHFTLSLSLSLSLSLRIDFEEIIYDEKTARGCNCCCIDYVDFGKELILIIYRRFISTGKRTTKSRIAIQKQRLRCYQFHQFWSQPRCFLLHCQPVRCIHSQYLCPIILVNLYVDWSITMIYILW